MGLGAALRNLVYVATDTETDATATYTIITDTTGGMYPDWSAGLYSGGMSIPGAWRAAILLSDLLGGVPWHAYRDGPGGVASRLPSMLLLEQPSPPDTRMSTFSSMALDLIWHGNAVAVWTGRDAAGRPTGLVPVPADRVGVRRVGQADNDQSFPVGEVVYDVGRARYGSAQVLHVKGPCRPGSLRGSGILENHLSGSLTLADDLATQARGVADSAVPSVDIAVENPDLTEAEAAALKAAFVASQTTRKPFVHGPTVKATPLSWNPSETQLLDARKFSLHELALIFGLDPSWLGAATSSRVYSNITEDTANLLRFSLGGHLARFEQAISAAMPAGQWVAASLDSLLRATTGPRYEAHARGIQAGFLLPNEARALENLPPVPGLDERWMASVDGSGGPAGVSNAQRADDPAPEHHRDESDLWLYWVSGKGRAKWTAAPEPLVALYGHLLKHMTPEQARATALAWFEDGMGRPVGPKDGQIPTEEKAS